MAEEKYQQLLESTSAIPWELDLETWRIVYVGPQVETILGYSVEECYKENFWAEHVHPDDAQHIKGYYRGYASLEQGNSIQYRMIAADGREVWVRDNIKVIKKNNNPVGLHGLMLDVTNDVRAKEAIKNIVSCVVRINTNDFFHNMVIHLARLFDAEYSFIGLLDEHDKAQMNTQAVCANDNIIDNFHYSLTDTPCADIVGHATCYHRTNVQKLFPNDILLQEMGIDSYIGTPLFDVKGEPIGIMVAISKKPMSISQEQIDILEILASSVSAEMERARSERLLESANQKLLLHMQHTPLGVIEWNTDFEVVEWNSSAEKIFGYSREEALGRKGAELIIPPQVLDHVDAVWSNLLAQKGGRRSCNENITRDGKIIMCEWYNTPLFDEDNKTIGVASLVDDITDRYKAEAEVQHLAFHDALTGLVNRSQFEQNLSDLLNDSHKHKTTHALLYMDLDQFKIINDTCGHAAGDAMLKSMTNLLQEKVRDSDTLARLGGDEFGILLTNCPLSQAIRIAEEIITAAKDFRFDWKGALFETGLSIGIAPITYESQNTSTIMSAADVACYMAKDMGRGRIRVYSSEDLELAERHGEMEWVSKINQAMSDQRFILFEQKIISLNNTDSLEHKELLLRLNDPDGELIHPVEFIPPAERFNLMPMLDRWVIHRAFCDIANIGSNNCIYSINLSGTSLGDNDLVSYIHSQFEETGLPPETICFEITETAAISNLARAVSLIRQLKSMGCQFALDDFGKGASSFTYLKNLPVDYLKIDGGFVTNFINDPADQAIIESINNIGHTLGIQTVAECVEDETSLEKLKDIGVNYAQGFVIARPQPFAESMTVKKSQRGAH